MSDTEFAVIRPPRDILNALFYLIRCGCPLRLLAKDFPPFTTACLLVMEAREAEGREAAPTAVVVDSRKTWDIVERTTDGRLSAAWSWSFLLAAQRRRHRARHQHGLRANVAETRARRF